MLESPRFASQRSSGPERLTPDEFPRPQSEGGRLVNTVLPANGENVASPTVRKYPSGKPVWRLAGARLQTIFSVAGTRDPPTGRRRTSASRTPAISCPHSPTSEKSNSLREWLSRHPRRKGLVETPQGYLARCLVRKASRSA